ncbi:cysteine desulfurase [Mesorhizobium sp. YR577]|uniref:aminotransferase class V-fold PLP-dependent enzyme n=1 Tax=Mesorhizobium sp. YR577 TaxID=1884373 RepID=UPI0008EA3B54|nr:cysteine desulfurase [Mesorhizobium sp. YR577]SFU22871.1 cysteine desulfurase / selenocysteine lyase [Mesorhizobium sp. YR577]
MLSGLRSDFPMLERRVAGRQIVYLDSAATALKPRQVIEAERRHATEATANVHRGNHALSEEASELHEAARWTMAEFLNVAPADVIFVKNATEAINVVASGLCLAKSDRILVFSSEHHSNILPWMRAGQVVWLDVPPDKAVSLDLVADALAKHRPRLLTFAHVSNVFGVVQPAREICRLAREANALSCVDAAQAISHFPVDVQEIGCDFLAFSGHKMLGPPGIGVLSGRRNALEMIEVTALGGGCVTEVTRHCYSLKALPGRLEPGTPNISGVLGLAAAVDYLGKIGWERIQNRNRTLAACLKDLVRQLPACQGLYSREESTVPIVSVFAPGAVVPIDTIAAALSDEFGVMARAGFHCTYPLHESLGLSGGTLRLSAHFYNEPAEITRAGEALSVLLTRFQRTGKWMA